MVFFFNVNQTSQGQINFNTAYYCSHCVFRFSSVICQYGQFVNSAHQVDVVLVSFYAFFKVSSCKENCRNFLPGRYVNFCTHVTDSFDAVHNCTHQAFSFIVHEFFFSEGPLGNHNAFCLVRQALVNFFGDEGHIGMQELHCAGENSSKYVLSSCTFFSVFFIVKTRFSKFDVPVANFTPDEVINSTTCFTQFKFTKQVGNFFGYMLQTGKNPFVCQSVGSKFRIGVITFNVHQCKAGSIPNFVSKVAGSFHTFPIEAHVIARSVTGDEHEAQGISTILVDNFQRVNAVAQGFGHFATLAITNKTVDEYFFEGNIFHEFHTHDEHTSNPEEDDVVTGYQYAGGIELI